MFKTTHFAFALMACFAVGTAAYAGPNDDVGPQHTISWDDFKYRCSDAKDKPLNEQGKPVNIRVVCTNVEREYIPGEPGSVALDSSRHVMTSILSDKFNVAAMGKDYPSTTKGGGSCLRYKEVERTIQAEKTLSCAEILSIKGDINDYCAANLDMVKGTSPKLIETRETGSVRDTCGGVLGGGKK
jgi:hypothetical protein